MANGSCPNSVACDCTTTFQVTDTQCQAEPPSERFYNTRQCASASCPESTTGEGVESCIESGRYGSDTSQADANAQALAAAQALADSLIISISSGTPDTPVIAEAYSFQFTATGGSGPYTFSYTGTLPTGLTLTSGGLLAGTPTESGTFDFTVTPHGSDGTGCSTDYELIVEEQVFANTLQTYNPCGEGYVDSNQTDLALDTDPDHNPDGSGYYTYGTYAEDGLFKCTAGYYTSLISQEDADAKALQACQDRYVRWAIIDSLGDVCCSPVEQPANTVLTIADLTWGTYIENTGTVTIAGGDGTFGSGGTGSTFHMFGFGYRWAEIIADCISSMGCPGTFAGESDPPGLWNTETYTVTVTVTFTPSGTGSMATSLNAEVFGGCTGSSELFQCDAPGDSPWTFQFEAKAYRNYSVVFCQARVSGVNLSASITLRPLTPP